MNKLQTITRQETITAKPRYWSPGLGAFAFLWCVVYFSLTPDPLELLARNFPFILVGFAGAVIGNLTALGGGLVFIPVLIFLYHTPPVAALKTAIVTQAFGMTSGALMWNKTAKIPWQILPWAVPGLLAGSLCSSLVIQPNAMLVKGLFGPVSIMLGGMLLWSLKHHESASEVWNDRAKMAVIATSALGGLITGWVAIGEGEIVAATLMLFFGYSANRAIPLGVCLLSINSVFLAAIHTSILGGIPWQIASFTILGCVFGARLAPLLTRYINARSLKQTFAIIAILDGLLFLLQFGLWQRG